MGARKVEKRFLVGLIALAIFVGTIIVAPKPAKALVCFDYSNALFPGWRIVYGGDVRSEFFDGVTRQVVDGAPITFSDGDPGSRVQLEYLFEPREVTSVTVFFSYAYGITLPDPHELGALVFYDYGGGNVINIVYDKYLRGSEIYGTQWFRFNTAVSANGILITFDQRGVPGLEPNPFIALGINEICFNQQLPTPTIDATFIPSTRTPTMTPSITLTRTPTLTLTPSETFTPTPTYTLGGPTVTETMTPSGTFTAGPTFASSLTGREIPTVVEGDTHCLDFANPCNPIGPPVFPKIDLPSPTGIAMLSSLTALPSMTARAGTGGTPAGTVTPGTPGPSIGYAATSISQMIGAFDGTPYYSNAEGTPVAGPQGIYEAGAAMGSLFGLARGLTTAELGRVGTLLTFLIAIIALNLLIRFGVFALPIALKLINLFLNFIQAILPFAIAIVFLLSVAPIHAQGPTPTSTPLPTWTPSPTLYPVQPTATSKYGGVLLTPTPFSINPDPTLVARFDMRSAATNFAQTVINMYHTLNQNNIANFVSFIAMVLILIAFLVRIQRKLTEKND